MFIEDEELRTLYKVSSTEHIDTIELGLIQLEKFPHDPSPLNALLRGTHSLKGDSRMLGVQEAEAIVHQMEDVLSAVNAGQQPVTPQLCDRLYKGLDAVRKIAKEATTGEPSGISTFHIMALLMGAEEEASTAPMETAFPLALDPTLEESLADLEELFSIPESSNPGASYGEPAALVHFRQDLLPSEPEAKPLLIENALQPEPLPAETFQLDTLRVESAKLDTLMTQADELAVTKRQIAYRLEDLAELVSLWEDWNREIGTQALEAKETTTSQPFYQQTTQRLAHMGQRLQQLQSTTADDTARLETVAYELENGIRNLRMLPLSSIFNLFPRMVRDLGQQQAKIINFVIEGDNLLADKRILETIKDPLTHLLRNAIDHGLETPLERRAAHKAEAATLRLRGVQRGSQICLEISDDGRGLDLNAIRKTAIRRGLHTEAELTHMSSAQIQALIFAPGFSTRDTVTEISGRGMGLDVVRANVERLKGEVQVESVPGQGCTFCLTLSTNLASTQALIVAVHQTPYALSLEAIETLQMVPREAIFSLEGSLTIQWQGKPVSVAWLSDLLDLPMDSPLSPRAIYTQAKLIPCVILRQGANYLGVLVDALLDQQQIVVKPHSKLLSHIRNIAGASILASGEVCMVLSPQDLFKSVGAGLLPTGIHSSAESVHRAPKILLVEDSIPIRTQMKRILEGAGYEVTAAVDGLDGFDKLQTSTFDAMVSDVEMPNLTGLELTRQVRECAAYDKLPIVLVTTLAQAEDQRRGADAGANAYITKGDFDQSLLLNTLRRLIASC